MATFFFFVCALRPRDGSGLLCGRFGFYWKARATDALSLSLSNSTRKRRHDTTHTITVPKKKMCHSIRYDFFFNASLLQDGRNGVFLNGKPHFDWWLFRLRVRRRRRRRRPRLIQLSIYLPFGDVTDFWEFSFSKNWNVTIGARWTTIAIIRLVIHLKECPSHVLFTTCWAVS